MTTAKGFGEEEIKQFTVEEADEKSRICAAILRALPEWFGIESAIVDYIRDVRQMLTIAIEVRGELAGFLSLQLHNPSTAEIHVMGVLEKFHRQGIGKRLVKAAEDWACAQEFQFLSVKTLSESRPWVEYDRTRNFYLRTGFAPVEEFKTLWGEANPCLLLIKSIRSEAGLLHHLNFKVSNLKRSSDFWGWFLSSMGYTLYDSWPRGVSWKLGVSYIDFVQVDEKYLGIPYHRDHVGFNHIAFHARSRAQVDAITAELKTRGVRILYLDRHPFAGGPDYYAVYFEDHDGIKGELVAPASL